MMPGFVRSDCLLVDESERGLIFADDGFPMHRDTDQSDPVFNLGSGPHHNMVRLPILKLSHTGVSLPRFFGSSKNENTSAMDRLTSISARNS